MVQGRDPRSKKPQPRCAKWYFCWNLRVIGVQRRTLLPIEDLSAIVRRWTLREERSCGMKDDKSSPQEPDIKNLDVEVGSTRNKTTRMERYITPVTWLEDAQRSCWMAVFSYIVAGQTLQSLLQCWMSLRRCRRKPTLPNDTSHTPKVEYRAVLHF